MQRVDDGGADGEIEAGFVAIGAKAMQQRHFRLAGKTALDNSSRDAFDIGFLHAGTSQDSTRKMRSLRTSRAAARDLGSSPALTRLAQLVCRPESFAMRARPSAVGASSFADLCAGLSS